MGKAVTGFLEAGPGAAATAKRVLRRQADAITDELLAELQAEFVWCRSGGGPTRAAPPSARSASRIGRQTGLNGLTIRVIFDIEDNSEGRAMTSKLPQIGS